MIWTLNYLIGEIPAIFAKQPIHHRVRKYFLQALQFANDQCPMGPRAGQGYIQVIAVLLSLEATRAISCEKNRSGKIKVNKWESIKFRRHHAIIFKKTLQFQNLSSVNGDYQTMSFGLMVTIKNASTRWSDLRLAQAWDQWSRNVSNDAVLSVECYCLSPF